MGDILELSYGKALKASDRDGGDVPVVGSGGIVGRHSAGITDSPTIVVGRKGSIGSVTWIDGPAWPIDTAYFVKPKRDDLDRRWAYWMLKSLGMETMNKSAAVPGLNRDDVYRLNVRLPSLPEQRRIAAILDHADALRAKRGQVLTHLDALTRAFFVQQFGAPQDWPQRWPMGTIGDLTEDVSYGTSGKASTSGAWPILRMGNVTDDGRLDLADLKYIDLSPADVPKYTVRPGDMLFNRTNSKEKVGKAAVVRTDQPLALAGYLVRVRFADAATAEFVSGYLASAHGVAVRQKLAKAAVNQANINASEMRRIEIAHPPSAVKQSYEASLKAIEAQRNVVQRALATDNALFGSLQSRAFRGEL